MDKNPAQEIADEVAVDDVGVLVVLMREEFNDGRIMGGSSSIGVTNIKPGMMEQIVRNVALAGVDMLERLEPDQVIQDMVGRLKRVIEAVGEGDISRAKKLN